MVSLKFSAWMIGPSFVTYALGSVAAVTNKRAVKAGMSEAFILASLGSGLWIFGLVSIPYMLVGRFFSGFFMFSSQSVVLLRSADNCSRQGMSRAPSGMLAGSIASGVWASPLAENFVPLMSSVAAIPVLLRGSLTYSLPKTRL